MKLIIVLRDSVANKVMNVHIEDNEMTMQRNLRFACASIVGSAINPAEIEIICAGKLNDITGEIIPVNDIPSTYLSEFMPKEEQDGEETCCEV